MSDNWDVYFTTINDHFASVLIDMGIAAEAPDSNRPWLLYVWVKLNDPDEHGMIAAKESEAINHVEDALVHEVATSVRAVHVGSVTREGRREFYFYAPTTSGFPESVNRIMQSIGTHQWNFASKEDPQWEHYLQTMYPTVYDRQVMHNRKVLDALSKAGDNLEKERAVFHWAYFTEEAARRQFIDAIQLRGFALDNQLQSDTPDDPYPYGVAFRRIDPLHWNTINDVTIELWELAESLAGSYNGWETSVEKDEKTE